VCWGLAAWQNTGAEAGRTYYLALLAEAYGKAGQADKGLSALADALALVAKTGDRRWEAELYRFKGQLTLQKWSVISGQFSVTDPRPLLPDSQGEAEACFLQAIEVARRQSAKSLELRAVMSVSRLWYQQGKTDKAQQLLAEIYGWFIEGFDTKDLQEAKALLEELT
jgi:predicted ATPase